MVEDQQGGKGAVWMEKRRLRTGETASDGKSDPGKTSLGGFGENFGKIAVKSDTIEGPG